MRVLVSDLVPQAYAPLFRPGDQAFPRGRLLAAGMVAEDVDRLETYRGTYANLGTATIVQEPEHSAPPDSSGQVRVSWAVTTGDLLGSHYTDCFRHIARYGPLGELRVICEEG